MARPKQRIITVDESRFRDSSPETWTTPEERERVAVICAAPYSLEGRAEMRELDAGCYLYRLSAPVGWNERDPLPAPSAEAAAVLTTDALRSIADGRRRAAVREWAGPRGLRAQEAADLFGLGWC